MAKSIKKTPNPDKSYIRDQVILNFLITGEKTFGEIKKHLKIKNIPYQKNSGLNFRLQSLKKQGVIDTHKISGNSFPTWYITEKELKDIGLQARLFANHAIRKVLQIPIPLKGHRSKEKRLVKKMVEEIGVYALFTMFQSYRLASEKTSFKEKSETHSAWMSNTLPLPFVSTYLHLQLQDLLGLQEYDMTTVYDMNKIKKIEKLETILEELYHKETTICKKVMKNLPEIIKKDTNTREFFNKSKNNDGWKKRLKEKNIIPKKDLKPNECPICSYDGTDKVKFGPRRGMIFPLGFHKLFTDEKGEHWKCQACWHEDIRPIKINKIDDVQELK